MDFNAFPRSVREARKGARSGFGQVGLAQFQDMKEILAATRHPVLDWVMVGKSFEADPSRGNVYHTNLWDIESTDIAN